MEKSAIMAVLKTHKKELKKDFNIQRIGLFGSYARGEQKRASDVDILVDFKKAPNLFEFIELKDKLRTWIGKPVDLVPKKALKHEIGKRIQSEVTYA